MPVDTHGIRNGGAALLDAGDSAPGSFHAQEADDGCGRTHV